jgi:hypothetical protein
MRHFRRDSFPPRRPNQFLMASSFSKNDAISINNIIVHNGTYIFA